jgi:hypothetical protein
MITLNPMQVERNKLTKLSLPLLREVDYLILISNTKIDAVRLEILFEKRVSTLPKLREFMESLADPLQ